VDPRDIHVYPSAVEEGAPAFSVRLTGKALVRFPMADRRPIAVRSLRQAESWLSIAAVNWPRHRVAGRCATILSSRSTHDRPKESGRECWAVAIAAPSSESGSGSRRRG
jgi:hypothetical protein